MNIKKSPALILIGGFAFIIMIGTILLGLPFMKMQGIPYSFINDFFTASSSVCVTGLTVVNISQYYSIFGQIVIMLLIQIGGFGYMTMATMIFLMVGKRLSMREQLATQTSIGVFSLNNIEDFVKYIIKFTLIIELIGAIVLSFGWFAKYHWKALYYGLFHSVSAFCNAGFSIFPDNLASSSNNPLIILSMAILIIFGGVGFIVVRDVLRKFRSKNSVKLTYHTRIVLILTACFIFIPMLILLFSEYSNVMTLGNMGFFKKLMVTFFHSVTTRTAGFNIIDISGFWQANLFLMFLLMFVGASPGGTGGGIKTTTFAILFSSIRSMLKGTYEVDMFKRRIDEQVVQKSWIIMFTSLCFISTILILLLFIEPKSIDSLLFEVMSAFGTVGLSLGITPYLCNSSKVLIIFTMFVGRIGPLTIATVMYFKRRKLPIRYAEEKILIG